MVQVEDQISWLMDVQQSDLNAIGCKMVARSYFLISDLIFLSSESKYKIDYLVNVQVARTCKQIVVGAKKSMIAVKKFISKPEIHSLSAN